MAEKSRLADPPLWLRREFYHVESRRIDVLSHEIHYLDEGSGPVLLLLHGNGSWSYGYRLTIPKLAPHFRVIALGYAGFGLSNAKEGFSFEPAEQSNIVEAFIDLLGLRDIRLFIEHWGGPIGLGVAGRRLDLFHSFVIMNSLAWPAQGHSSFETHSNVVGGPVGRLQISRANALCRYLVPVFIITRKLSTGEQEGYYLPYPTAESRLPQCIFAKHLVAGHDFLAEVESGLKGLRDKPVQIIWGGVDPGFKEEQKTRFLEVWPKAKVLSLPHAKHFVSVDEPDVVADTIISFAL